VKIAAIQHELRPTAEDDARAMAASAERAVAAGAEVVIYPEAPSLDAGAGEARELLYLLLSDVPAAHLVPHSGPDVECLAFVTEAPPGGEGLGRLGVATGDAALDPEQHAALLREHPSTLVLSPRSESELQAEAMLELGLGLSESLAGLVVIAECAGAAPGAAGHGGSAIVFLGDVIAEAIGDGDDVLLADVLVPLAQPEPREALPVLPTILVQRLAHHRGQPVPHAYLADLT